MLLLQELCTKYQISLKRVCIHIKELFFTLVLLYVGSGSFAQTCCSGGVPLSTNLGFTTSEVNTLHLAISADFNKLNKLYNVSEQLSLNNRNRSTNSYLLRAGYDLAHGISFEALLPYVVQHRRITQNNGLIDKQRSSGIGDIVLLARKKLFLEFFSISINAGIKLPSGSTSEVNDSGFLLVNDLQPGSGSIDGIFILSASVPLRGAMDFYSSINYQYKGSDNDYLGSLKYGFGDEIQIRTGISDQITISNQIFSPSFGLRYRHRLRDKIDSDELDNTGGLWLMAQIGFNWLPNPSTNISVQFDHPLYTAVDGTQLSNDYILNFTVYKKISFND